MKKVVAIALGLAALFAAFAALVIPAGKDGQALAQSRTYPSNAQCWAGQRKGQGYVTGCRSEERFCPNASSDSAAKGYALRGAPSCIPKTPAELAEERAAAQRKARFEAEVQAEVSRLGAHREGEIRRRLELRENALSLRPTPPPRQCTTQTLPRSQSWQGKDQASAMLSATRGSANVCGRDAKVSTSPPACKRDPVLQMTRPPIGTCLACISEKQAIALGYVPGRGWPKPNESWTCSVSAQCKVEKCTGDGPAAVSRQ